jgi:hypothetical protein
MNQTYKWWNLKVSKTAVALIVLILVCTAKAEEKQEPGPKPKQAIDEKGIPASSYYLWYQDWKNKQGKKDRDLLTGKIIKEKYAYHIPFDLFKSDTLVRNLLRNSIANIQKNVNVDSALQAYYDMIGAHPERTIMSRESVRYFGTPPFMESLRAILAAKENPQIFLFPKGKILVDNETVGKLRNAKSCFKKAEEHSFNKDFNNAIKEYANSLSYWPDNWICYLSISICYERMGDKKRAEHYLDIASAIPWSDEQKIETRRKEMKESPDNSK